MAAPSALDTAAGLDLDRAALAPDTAAHVLDTAALALDMAVAVFLDIAVVPGWDMAAALDFDIAAHVYSVVVATVAECSVAATEGNGAVELDADYSGAARAFWRAGRGKPSSQRSPPLRATAFSSLCSSPHS